MKIENLTFILLAVVLMLTETPTALSQSRRVNVEFKRGTTGGTYTGSVIGYGTVDFVFKANAGQILSVKLTSSDSSLYFVVSKSGLIEALTDSARDSTEWSGQLSETGEYVVRVYLYRNAARRTRNPVKFSLRLDINAVQVDRQKFKSDCAGVRFHHLDQYKHQWGGVFQDKEVSPALKALLKEHYHKLLENMRQASYPEDSLSFVDRQGVLTVRGFVPGLFTVMEAMLIIEPCGSVYVAILDDGDQFLYFSNDKEYLDRLPPAIEQWRANIEKARSSLERKPELPVVFKSK